MQTVFAEQHVREQPNSGAPARDGTFSSTQSASPTAAFCSAVARAVAHALRAPYREPGAALAGREPGCRPPVGRSAAIEFPFCGT